MKRLAIFCFLAIYISSVFAFRVQDGKTNAWATYYTEAGYQRSLINGWTSSNPQTNKNNVYFMPFKLNGDFLTSQLFDAQNNALAIVMEIFMPSGGKKQCQLIGLNADSTAVETLNIELDGADFTSGTNKYFNSAVFVFKNEQRNIRRVRFEYGNELGSTQYLRMQWFEIRDTTWTPSALETVVSKKMEIRKEGASLIITGIADNSMVEIYTLLGNKLLEKNLTNNRLSVADLPKGIYIVRSEKLSAKIVL